MRKPRKIDLQTLVGRIHVDVDSMFSKRIVIESNGACTIKATRQFAKKILELADWIDSQKGSWTERPQNGELVCVRYTAPDGWPRVDVGEFLTAPNSDADMVILEEGCDYYDRIEVLWYEDVTWIPCSELIEFMKEAKP